MIDFHTHILPNIDDGARDIEETFNLIEEAKRAGFDKIVLTPHYMEGYYETDVAEREVWLDAISKNLFIKNYDGELYIGNEIYMSENLIKLLENAKASTINNTSYVLFELPLNAEPLNLYDIIYEMQQYKIVPILAHPERYSFIRKEPELLYDLAQKGVLMQCNFGSIIGQYGNSAKIFVKKMFENKYVHFLGTDVHRQNTIYKNIPECLMEIRKIIGEEKLHEITTTNPTLALANKRIDVDTPKKFELSLKEKMLMNMKFLNK